MGEFLAKAVAEIEAARKGLSPQPLRPARKRPKRSTPSGQGPWPDWSAMWPAGPTSTKSEPQARGEMPCARRASSRGRRPRPAAAREAAAARSGTGANPKLARRPGVPCVRRPALRVVDVGRRDEEGAGDGALRQLRRRVRDGDDAEAVGDEHRRARRRVDRRDDVADPRVLVGRRANCPARCAARLEIALPARLPVVGPELSQPGTMRMSASEVRHGAYVGVSDCARHGSMS